MRTSGSFAVILFALGCGGGSKPAAGDGPPPTDGIIDMIIAGDDCLPGLDVTSTAFNDGTTIPTANTCDGANTSPDLAWATGPCNAMSFAVVLTDKTINLVHSVIYDIPVDLRDLPADVDKVYAPPDVPGAHQTKTLGAGNPFGYSGPCPPVNDGAHTYEFAIYALDVATLPGATMNTTKEDATLSIETHGFLMATLTGTYSR